jgi:hypothetical protein
LFHTLHLHTIFEIYDDLEACIRSFRWWNPVARCWFKGLKV